MARYKVTVHRFAEYLADRDVACASCGYNLRGLSTSVCPECGRGIEIPAWFGIKGFTEQARMAQYLATRDFVCHKCQTNLRGRTSNICPTCGTTYILREAVSSDSKGKRAVGAMRRRFGSWGTILVILLVAIAAVLVCIFFSGVITTTLKFLTSGKSP